MKIKKYYFMLVLLTALLFGTTESIGYSHAFSNQENSDKGSLTEANETNQGSMEDHDGDLLTLNEKVQQMNKEYRILMNEKNRLNTDLTEFYKNRSNRKRSSRKIKQKKLFDAERQEFYQKYADYIDRRKKLDTEIKEFNEIERK